jgi:serine/threonine-protein kinase
LFDEGLELLKKEQTKEACSRLEASQRIDPAVGTLLYLGECFQKLQRTASAWASFREAASMARAQGQASRAEAGERRARELEPRLGRVILKPLWIQAPLGLQLVRDGEKLPAASLGSALPSDAGEHVLEVSAPGYLSSRVNFSLTDAATLTVELPILLPEPSAVVPEPTPAPLPIEAEKSLHPLTWVGVGVGVAGIAAGAFFGVRASSKDHDAKKYCEGARCFDTAGSELSSQARTSAVIANVCYGVGALGVVTGLAAAFFGGSTKPAQSARIDWVPSIDLGKTPGSGAPNTLQMNFHGTF